MLCMPSIEFPSIPISLKGKKTVDFDIGTLALAFCYFERLVLYGVGFALGDSIVARKQRESEDCVRGLLADFVQIQPALRSRGCGE